MPYLQEEFLFTNHCAVTSAKAGKFEDHTLLAIVIILEVLVPIGAVLLYLRCESLSPLPDGSGKPYRAITTDELPSRKGGNVSFKFEM